MYYRVFISEKGKFRNRDYYEYAAEFSERDFVAKTVRWIRKRKRFSEKDIIIIEAEHSEIDPHDGRVGGVITVMGESLQVDEYDIR